MEKKILCSILILGLNLATFAQCAMCKTTAEQGASNGNEESQWLNYGIIMLIVFPLIIILGIYWLYKKNYPSE